LGNFFSQPFLKNLFLNIAQMLNTGSIAYLGFYSLMICSSRISGWQHSSMNCRSPTI